MKHNETASEDDEIVTKRIVTIPKDDEDTEDPEEDESVTKASKSATVLGSTKVLDTKKKVEKGDED